MLDKIFQNYDVHVQAIPTYRVRVSSSKGVGVGVGGNPKIKPSSSPNLFLQKCDAHPNYFWCQKFIRINIEVSFQAMETIQYIIEPLLRLNNNSNYGWANQIHTNHRLTTLYHDY